MPIDQVIACAPRDVSRNLAVVNCSAMSISYHRVSIFYH